MAELTTIPETLARWQAVREELKAIERAEHPDFTDAHGRVWTWHSGSDRDEIYQHDGMCWLRGFDQEEGRGVTRTDRLAPPSLADNPNYKLCTICRSEWPDA